MKALVLGGTSYFGIELVNHLLSKECDVTVATGKMTSVKFIREVKRAKVERTKLESLKELAASGEWDVVYDQICYSAHDAKVLLDGLQGSVGKIVFTSSVGVYPLEPGLTEAKFDPSKRNFDVEVRANYDEGKRDAEAVYTQCAKVPYVAGRLAVVLGGADVGSRLSKHVEKIAAELPIKVPSLNAKSSFIHYQDAGHFMAWLGLSDVTGAFNGAAPTAVSPTTFAALIGEALGKTPALTVSGEGWASGLFRGIDAYLDVSKVQSRGFQFKEIKDFLGGMAREIHPERNLPRGMSL